MAIKTSLRPIARRISDAVRDYAASNGWVPGDYALTGAFNERNDRISLVLATDRKIDEHQWYIGLLGAIRAAFPEYPQMVMHIGLVVKNVSSLDEAYAWPYLDEEEADLTELFD
jgi:hypothetical protein